MPSSLPEQPTSFEPGSNALIIGASGGIGRELVNALCDLSNFDHVFATGRISPTFDHPKVHSFSLDLTDEASIENVISQIGNRHHLSLVIMATGLLHDGENLQPEKSWRSINASSMARSYAVNCIGPALVLKHVLPTLRRDQRNVTAALSARVGSIGDNRLGGWYAYRSAKAALNMTLKTASIELARSNKNASIVGLHPGTVDTALSAPFQGNVPDGKLFSPQRAARQLLNVVDQITPADTGRVFDWQGDMIDP